MNISSAQLFSPKVTISIHLVKVQFQHKVESTIPNFNFIVLNSSDPNSASDLNCYYRALNEGMPCLMDLCNFNPAPNPSGKCSTLIKNAAANGFASQKFFSNCTDSSLDFNLTASNQDQTDEVNGTLLFLMDNSGLFPSVSSPTSKINLIL